MLLENPNLLEHDRFTDLLWAVTHLDEELQARPSITALPDKDLEHLAGDIRRMYDHLASEWLDYVQHLKSRYPFLFFTGSQNASVPGTPVPYNNLIEPRRVISECRSLHIWAGRFRSVSARFRLSQSGSEDGKRQKPSFKAFLEWLVGNCLTTPHRSQ